MGRGIALTEAGTLFLVEARAILARVEAAELVLSDLGGLLRGTLAIQASHTIASYWLPRHLVAFRRAYPAIAIRLTIGNTAQVAAAIHDGTAELGFVEGATDDPALVRSEVARDQLVVVVGIGHPWAAASAVSVADLAAAEWVLREPGSGTRSELEAALRGLGVPPDKLRVVLELPSNQSVRSAVEAGLGATAISASVAAASLEAGLLHQVAVRLPDRAFCALSHAERTRSPAADRLLELIRR